MRPISVNDYLRFMTEQVVTYIDSPSEERKNRRAAQKNDPPIYSNRWLGVLPFALRTIRKKSK
ncbi:YqzE family protein [Virgibacillus natechei]|nr:YqzE family protein [Virgibacillus natechei]UZD11458.1 YqzE family protein [Virgibacillus natechei]